MHLLTNFQVQLWMYFLCFMTFIPYLDVLYFVFCTLCSTLRQHVTNPASWLPECNKCDLINCNGNDNNQINQETHLNHRITKHKNALVNSTKHSKET